MERYRSQAFDPLPRFPEAIIDMGGSRSGVSGSWIDGALLVVGQAGPGTCFASARGRLAAIQLMEMTVEATAVGSVLAARNTVPRISGTALLTTQPSRRIFAE